MILYSCFWNSEVDKKENLVVVVVVVVVQAHIKGLREYLHHL